MTLGAVGIALVGVAVGAAVGNAEGLQVGTLVGATVGIKLGGKEVGLAVGLVEGEAVVGILTIAYPTPALIALAYEKPGTAE